MVRVEVGGAELKVRSPPFDEVSPDNVLGADSVPSVDPLGDSPPKVTRASGFSAASVRGEVVLEGELKPPPNALRDEVEAAGRVRGIGSSSPTTLVVVGLDEEENPVLGAVDPVEVVKLPWPIGSVPGPPKFVEDKGAGEVGIEEGRVAGAPLPKTLLEVDGADGGRDCGREDGLDGKVDP